MKCQNSPSPYKILHVSIHDIRGLDALARFERLVDRLAGFEVADTNTIERLAFARFDEFVLDNDAGIGIDDDPQAGSNSLVL